MWYQLWLVCFICAGSSVEVADTDPKLFRYGTVDEEYNYVIDYDKTDYPDIESPDCGYEIDQMDVSLVSKPNQIRLAYTGDPTEMSITWTTNGISSGSDWLEEVRFGPVESDLNYTAIAVYHQYKWVCDDATRECEYVSGYIHEALMVNLIPGQIHFYQIKSNFEESDVVKFVAAPAHGDTAPLSFMHVGDVGTFGTSVMVTSDMMKNMEEKQYHGVIHCGDISYANKFNGSRPNNAEQKVWDTWGQMVEPVGSKIPYMAVPGNHELDIYDSTNENNTIYTKRFMMPGNERYYSFGVGMVHFVAVSTDESIDATSTQGVWLDRKLEYLNKNRDLWPWVVVFQHRPIYNSNKNHGNWTGANNYTYEGYDMPIHQGWPDHYESLILKHDVDFVLNGHVHHYERTWPVRNRDQVTQSYENVKSPIHITCGNAGKDLYKRLWDYPEQDTYDEVQPAFSASRSNELWGHCEIEFLNRTAAKHTMYAMGSDTPRDEIIITKSGDLKTTLNFILLALTFISGLL